MILTNSKMKGQDVGDGIKVWGGEYNVQRDVWVYAFKRDQQTIYLEVEDHGAAPNHLAVVNDLLPSAREKLIHG